MIRNTSQLQRAIATPLARRMQQQILRKKEADVVKISTELVGAYGSQASQEKQQPSVSQQHSSTPLAVSGREMGVIQPPPASLVDSAFKRLFPTNRRGFSFRSVVTNQPFSKEQLAILEEAAAVNGWTSPYWGTWAQLRRMLGADVRVDQLPTVVSAGDSKLYPIEALEDEAAEQLLITSPPWFASGVGIYRGKNHWTHIMSHRIELILNPHREIRKLYISGAVVENLRIRLKIDVNSHSFQQRQQARSRGGSSSASSRHRDEDDLCENGVKLDWHQIQQRRGAAPPLDFRAHFPLELYNSDQLEVPERGFPLRGLALNIFGRRLPQPAHDYLLTFGTLRNYSSPFWLTKADLLRSSAKLHPTRSVIEICKTDAGDSGSKIPEVSVNLSSKRGRRDAVKGSPNDGGGDASTAGSSSSGKYLASAAIKASTMAGIAIPLSCCHPEVRTFLEMMPSASDHMIEHDTALMMQNSSSSSIGGANDVSDVGSVNNNEGGDEDVENGSVDHGKKKRSRKTAPPMTEEEQRLAKHKRDLARLHAKRPYAPTLLFGCGGWERVRQPKLVGHFYETDEAFAIAKVSGRTASDCTAAGVDPTYSSFDSDAIAAAVDAVSYTTHWVNIDEVIPMLPRDVREAIGLPVAPSSPPLSSPSPLRSRRKEASLSSSSASPIALPLVEARWLVVDHLHREGLREAVRKEEGIDGVNPLTTSELEELMAPTPTTGRDRDGNSKQTVAKPRAKASAASSTAKNANPPPFINLKKASEHLFWNAMCLEKPSLCNIHTRSPIALRFDGLRFGSVAQQAFLKTSLRRDFASPLWVTRNTAKKLGVRVLANELDKPTMFANEMAVAMPTETVERYYHISDLTNPKDVLQRFPIALSPHVETCHWVLRHRWSAVGSPRRGGLLDLVHDSGAFSAAAAAAASSHNRSAGAKTNRKEHSADANKLPASEKKLMDALERSKLWIDCDEAILYGWVPKPDARVAVLRIGSGVGDNKANDSRPSKNDELSSSRLRFSAVGGTAEIISISQHQQMLNTSLYPAATSADSEIADTDGIEGTDVITGSSPEAEKEEEEKEVKKPTKRRRRSSKNDPPLRRAFRPRLAFSRRKWYNAMQTTDPVKVNGLATYFYRPKGRH